MWGTGYGDDSPREDVAGAQSVGMRAVWMVSDEFELGDVRPDAIIHTLPELTGHVDRWDDLADEG